MDYNDRFNTDTIKSKEFRSNNSMIDWLNENSKEIDLIQVYTSVDRICRGMHSDYEYFSIFHAMYKTKKQKVII